MTGTLVSQGLIIASVPFLSRLYSVSLFGEMGMFMLISVFCTQLFCWRYELGIAAALNEKLAARLLGLCIIAGLISAMFFSAVLYFLAPVFAQKSGFLLRYWLPWLIMHSFASALWNAFTFYNVRNSAFRRNATMNVIRAVLIVSLSFFFFYWLEVNGLIFGLIVGQLMATVLLIFPVSQQVPGRVF